MDENIIYKIYARIREDGTVTKIFGSHFEQVQDGDVLIEETEYRHGANRYQVEDEKGIYNYSISNGQLVERDKTADLKAYKEKQYPVIVSQYIRLRYSIDDEFAILRQRDTKPDEYEEYNSYCEECKARAKAIVENPYRR